jgi:hypothetical protein
MKNSTRDLTFLAEMQVQGAPLEVLTREVLNRAEVMDWHVTVEEKFQITC